MITAGDFRKGVTFEMDGKVWVVIDFLHVKPGKGSPVIERKEMQYLYNDGELYYFMDMETYEQMPLNKDQVGEAMQFMTENMNAQIQFYKGQAFSVEPPTFVELTITETEPGIQGDTSKAGYKPATLETGYELQVPLFCNQGEKIRVDTRDGSYMERVK